MAALGGERGGRRVVELGHDVDEGGADTGGEVVGEDVDPEAVAVARDAEEVGTAEAQGLDGADVAGVGQRHDVARVDQGPHHELERLLGAVGDDDVVGVGAVAQRVGHPRPQRGEAGGRRVLEGAGGIVGQHLGGGPGDVLHRERVGGGQAPGQGQHVVALGDGEQVADGRGADPLGRSGQAQRRSRW